MTIVLDGQPYVERHLPVFQKLRIPWRWFIIEGAAGNTMDTSWCKLQRFRLSEDGTSEYLKSIKDPRVQIVQRPKWDNKTAMCNTACKMMLESGVLMQIDSDEIWRADQLEVINDLFSLRPEIMHMRFFCRYFLGPDIVATEANAYGNNGGEWLRAWRFRPGMMFNRHEPPMFNSNRGAGLSREETKKFGLVFDHFSYVLEKQLAYKEMFYGYKGALESWKKLQANTEWPVKLKKFLYWVDDNAIADKLK